jgi:hypothetical protein
VLDVGGNANGASPQPDEPCRGHRGGEGSGRRVDGEPVTVDELQVAVGVALRPPV